ncbi:MAG: NTP transferase domain-containing protein [Actinoallomurus sp.]
MSAPATVVIPCAGRGTRLGLPFPKELLPAASGVPAIDCTLDLVRACDSCVRVVLVTGSDRAATVDHVRSRLRYPVAVVGQDPAADGLAGAVTSALPWCPGPTVVLLPDQVLTRPAPGLLDRALEALEWAPCCFLAASEHDPERIAVDGALATEVSDRGRRVRALADKPGRDAAGAYDAVWFGLGFVPARAPAVIEHMAAAVEHRLEEAAFRAGPLLGAPVIECPPFTDLGTWAAYTRHWKDAACN